jgi:cytoskeleton protein RodZ
VPESLRQLIPDRSSGEPPPAKAPAPLPAAPAAAPMASPPADPARQPQASPAIAPPSPAAASTTTAAAPAPVPPAASIPAAPAGAPAPPSDTAGNRIILRASSDAWVEVRDRPGRTVLISRILKAGETFPVPNRPGLTLLTGNAGGIEVIIDGQALAPLGKAGSVKRNVALDAEQLRGSLNAAN